MWLFLSESMLMPALIPQSVLDRAETPDIQEAVERGWELQVRGRVTQHLTAFAEKYMPEGSFSEVYTSMDKDYTCRFYTTRAAFGVGLYNASMAMDYTKFKDTAKESKYHSLLLKVWSASASAFGAGGFYGARSEANPRGFRPARTSKRGNRRGSKGSYVGSSFFDDEDYEYEQKRPKLTERYNQERYNSDDYLGQDDLPMWATRSNSKSIHDMTDAELAELDGWYES